MYIKLQGSTICCYKDQKSAKNHPEAYYKGESPIELRNGSVERAADYTKKTNVFRIKCEIIAFSWYLLWRFHGYSVVNFVGRTQNGAEYLFQPREDDTPDLNQWINSISAIIEEGVVAGPSKSQTLPAAPATDRKKDKKAGFFTLKKR